VKTRFYLPPHEKVDQTEDTLSKRGEANRLGSFFSVAIKRRKLILPISCKLCSSGRFHVVLRAIKLIVAGLNIEISWSYGRAKIFHGFETFARWGGTVWRRPQPVFGLLLRNKRGRAKTLDQGAAACS
jgi:hypothetical protein